jgi:hypothetical protein
MGEAENLANAAQALTTAAQKYADAAGECMNVTGSAITLGHELKTTWQGKASDTFMGNLDKLSGDSFNLMGAFNAASSIMNGLALAIQANLGPISTAEKLQQQAEGFEQLTPSVLQQLSQAQTAANAALATITYLANSAAGSLEAVNMVGVCSTGLGVMNLNIDTPSANGKTSIIVDGKTLLVIDDATGDILENNTGGGGGGNPPTPPTGGGHWWEDGWFHDWWGKDAPMAKKIFMRLLVGFGVSTVSNGASSAIQNKPWNWSSWAIQGGLLSAGYETSLGLGFKGPVDKIFSSLVSVLIVGLVQTTNGGGNKPNPSPGPSPTAPAPTATVTAPPSHAKSSLAPTPTPSPSPSATPSVLAPIH